MLLGLAGGLYVGWVLSPVELVDVGPDFLRVDYQTDYVLMVAENYASRQNPEEALAQLEFLGDDNPLGRIETGLDFAEKAGYFSADLTLMRQLNNALREWDPRLELTPTP